MAIPCAQLGTVNLDGTLVAADLRAIAADASGTMYGAAWDGKIYRISSAGATLGSLTTSTTNLTDIDLSATGQIIAGGRFGNVSRHAGRVLWHPRINHLLRPCP